MTVKTPEEYEEVLSAIFDERPPEEVTEYVAHSWICLKNTSHI